MSRRLVALLAAFAVAGALAACGGDDEDEGDQGTAGAAAATVTISERDFALDPADARVEQAGVVEFDVVNDGDTVHALEIEGPDGEAETGTIQPGERATLRVELPEGTFEMYCPVGDHRARGMAGTVTVGTGGGGGAQTEGGGGGAQTDGGGIQGGY